VAELTIQVSDADYQQLERDLALRNVALERERIVYQRRIAELTRETDALRTARDEMQQDRKQASPGKQAKP
jgi:hypothetical protein